MKLALVLLALAAPATAQTVVAQSEAPAARDAAQELAAIVLPRESVIAARLPRFEEAYAERSKTDTRLTTLEKTRPGITNAVAAAANDEAAKGYGTAINLLQADVAKLYRDRFTPAELRTLIGFFLSATGKAMIAMSAEGSGESASAFEADRRAKAIAYFQNLDDTGKAELKTLIDSGLLPKLRTIGPEISALSARRFDDVSNLVEAVLPARIEAVIAAYPKATPQ